MVIARRVATVLSATGLAVIVRMATSLGATGRSATVPAMTAGPVQRVMSARAQGLSMASSAPNVPAAIALKVIVRPVEIGPLASALKANVPSAIARPASLSARSRAAANPLAASRVGSPVARAASAASRVAQVAPRAAHAAAPVVVAPAGAAPRAAGVSAR